MNPLIGTWQIDPNDSAAIAQHGLVTIEFKKNGQLIYTIDAGNKFQQIFLNYWVVGDKLITNQPTSPREETTRYAISGDKLILFYEGTQATFLRSNAAQPKEL